jgi:hypothetical protein
VWWPGLKNSPTVTHACRKRRLKWVPSAWGYSWATLSPGVINMEAWSSCFGIIILQPFPFIYCLKQLRTRGMGGRPTDVKVRNWVNASARNGPVTYMPVHHTETSFYSSISYRNLPIYTIAMYRFPDGISFFCFLRF